MAQHSENGSKEMGPASMLRRRSMLAGVGALAVGLVAAKTAQPVSANDGPLTMGAPNTSTAETHMSGTVPNGGILMHLSSSGTGSALEAYGDGGGVGVLGWSGQKDGVNGTTAISDSTHAGVSGIAGFGGNGVLGEANGSLSSYGVWGKTDSGVGVRASSTTSGTGAFGTSNSGSGIIGTSVSGMGVQGQSSSGNAVYGQSATGYGVLGYTTGGSASLSGISTNVNIPAFAGGNSVANGLAAHFSGTVYVNGQFVVADMTQKHGLLKHPDGSHRLMYTIEAPESWAEDFGTGTLAGGRADVKLDPDFAALIHTEDYHVFLTSHGDYHVHVADRRATGFVAQVTSGAGAAVRGLGGVSGTFSWRVVAKPKSDKKVERLGKFVVPNVPLPDVSKLPKLPEHTKKP